MYFPKFRPFTLKLSPFLSFNLFLLNFYCLPSYFCSCLLLFDFQIPSLDIARSGWSLCLAYVLSVWATDVTNWKSEIGGGEFKHF